MIDQVDTAPKKVRSFGLLFGFLFLAIAAYLLYRERAEWVWLAVPGILFILAGIALPSALRPVYVAWMKFAFVLAWINTRLILGIFFYFVLTPLGFLLRMMGKDLLEERIDKNAKSYWIPREQRFPDRKRLERLF